MFKQPNGAAIDKRQQVSVKIGLRLLGWFIVDAALGELLTRPLAPIAISVDFRTAIAFEQGGKLLDYSFGRERRLALADQVYKLGLAFLVRDCERHGI